MQQSAENNTKKVGLGYLIDNSNPENIQPTVMQVMTQIWNQKMFAWEMTQNINWLSKYLQINFLLINLLLQLFFFL